MKDIFDDNQTENEEYEITKDLLCKHLTRNFVRRNNAFYSIKSPTVSVNASDVKRLALMQFKKYFPEVELTQELVRDVFKHAIDEHHNDEEQTLQIWDGSQVCRPDIDYPIVLTDDLVRLNNWRKPAYRRHTDQVADMRLLTDLLDEIFQNAVDRQMFIDWLSWCLQNESSKPGWAVMLYSRRKGTGKSTLCALVEALFGKANTMPVNGISKVTNRFNMPVVSSKLIIAEEVQLKHGSTQGNSLKTFVTEKEVTTEGKGKEAEKLPQCCCFLLTSNHFPSWIEAHERRYFVIDVDHSGHASGPDAAAFGERVAAIHQAMSDDKVLAALFNALMVHKQSNRFSPSSLNVAAIDTPIMKRVSEGSTEVVIDLLTEQLKAHGRFAISQRELARWFNDKLKANSARVPHLMPELGWIRDRVKWGGCDYARVVWVHPDYSVIDGRVVGPDGYDAAVDPIEDEMDIL